MPNRYSRKYSPEEAAARRRAQDLARYYARRAEALELLGGKCQHVDCDETENLQVDHIRREDKVSSKIYSWSKARRLAELAKCQLLCEYHHVEKTTAEVSDNRIPDWAFYR